MGKAGSVPGYEMCHPQEKSAGTCNLHPKHYATSSRRVCLMGKGTVISMVLEDPPPWREGSCSRRDGSKPRSPAPSLPGPCPPRLATPLTCGLRPTACCTRSVTARSAGPSPSLAAMPTLHIPGRPPPPSATHTRPFSFLSLLPSPPPSVSVLQSATLSSRSP
uniref:Uncharacterized protein n=1 Tax=Nothoprocta perdicaria TaxID=30464 RepID=A0A8C6ZKE2_NOTPE